MKTAIYIEDGVTQVVLTPESDHENKAVELLTAGVGRVYRGEFYLNHGGWYSNDRQSSKSAILVVQKEAA